jgi:histidinol-phosphatase (PHP family)
VDGPGEEFERDLREKFDGDGEALMETYWEAVMDMLREGGFDVLGHMDLIKKNNPPYERPQGRRQGWFSPEGERYLRRIAQAVSETAASGVVVELNTGGLNRGKTTEPYPSLGILRLLKEKDVPIIITADAHRAGHLRGHYDTARQTLLDAGYTRTVLFEGRQNGRPVWSSEELACPAKPDNWLYI